jgi:hypothetical protein
MNNVNNNDSIEHFRNIENQLAVRTRKKRSKPKKLEL